MPPRPVPYHTQPLEHGPRQDPSLTPRRRLRRTPRPRPAACHRRVQADPSHPPAPRA
jgi:hypothetical protein